MRTGKPQNLHNGFSQYGFTYIGLLMFIAICGIFLAVIGQVWHVEAQREKERELLFIGDQFRNAIGSYYQSSPGDPKQYPLTLEDLLLDKRSPVELHHLRKLYRDPFTGRADWGLVKDQGRIVGVYSQSMMKPLKQAGFSAQMDEFNNAGSYQDWRFISRRETTIASSTEEALPAAAGADNSALPDSQPKPASAGVGKTKEVYEDCGKQLDEANAGCRVSCADTYSASCRSCLSQAFAQYRSCI